MSYSFDARPPPPYRSSFDCPSTLRHEYYYLEDGNLVIQVENVLFNVWNVTFRRHSNFFERMGIHDARTQIYDDLNPLRLPQDIRSCDFERLLWILYPPIIGQCKAKTSEEWISILDLSTRWEFSDVRGLAVRELEKCSLEDVDKIVLMQKYKINRRWALGALVGLCLRNGAIDVSEGQRLGIETTVKIASVREKIDQWFRKRPEDVRTVVCEVFDFQNI